MKDYKLIRTGDVPLSFCAELLADEAGKWHNGRDRNRWIDLAVYRTERGRYVVERVYRTMWQGESDHHEAVAREDLAGVVEMLRSWDPSRLFGIGYPPGDQFAERQSRMLEDLRSLYRDRITKILDELGAEERVE